MFEVYGSAFFILPRGSSACFANGFNLDMEIGEELIVTRQRCFSSTLITLVNVVRSINRSLKSRFLRVLHFFLFFLLHPFQPTGSKAFRELRYTLPAWIKIPLIGSNSQTIHLWRGKIDGAFRAFTKMVSDLRDQISREKCS